MKKSKAMSMAGLILLTAPAHAETIAFQFFACSSVETINRVSAMNQSGDKSSASTFMQQQISLGECVMTRPIGTTVRVEQRSLGRVCIAPFGSIEPCRWTYSNAVK